MGPSECARVGRGRSAGSKEPAAPTAACALLAAHRCASPTAKRQAACLLAVLDTARRAPESRNSAPPCAQDSFWVRAGAQLETKTAALFCKARRA